MKKRLAIALSLISASVFAAELAPNDRKKIEAELSSLTQAFQQNNIAQSVEVMPPALLNYMAKQAKVDTAEFKKALVDISNSITEQVKLEDYRYDIANTHAKKSTNGRDYAFIPTVTKMNMNGQIITVDGYLLGVEEKGQWHFINWDKEYIPIIKAVYPDLEGIKAPQ
ncbi:hypothetical protein [Glaesserella sp.]|uniref:hypothetical protein n=1 Tax=Glaesserella sp. TaxID=2094731 RepID=UPI0035A09083